jgi:hypothetical protein
MAILGCNLLESPPCLLCQACEAAFVPVISDGLLQRLATVLEPDTDCSKSGAGLRFDQDSYFTLPEAVYQCS